MNSLHTTSQFPPIFIDFFADASLFSVPNFTISPPSVPRTVSFFPPHTFPPRCYFFLTYTTYKSSQRHNLKTVISVESRYKLRLEMELFDVSRWMQITAVILVLALAYSYYQGRKPTVVSRSTPSVAEPPKLEEELSPQVAAVLRLIEEPASESWETIKESTALSIFRKKTGDSPVAIVKARALIEDVSAEDVMQVIWDVHVRATWDTVMKGFQEVEVHSADSSVITFFVKPPVPFISARDFVQLRCRQKVGTSTVISYQSVDRPDVPVVEGMIRGNTILSGYRIEQKPGNQCMVDFISQTDIKGSIPVGILNTVAPTRAADWIKKMGVAAQSLRKRDQKTQ